jgi:hypothetical protein
VYVNEDMRAFAVPIRREAHWDGCSAVRNNVPSDDHFKHVYVHWTVSRFPLFKLCAALSDDGKVSIASVVHEHH